VKILIDESGAVKDAQVARSDNAVFEEASLTAARQWTFTPASTKGKPVAAWVTVPFRFALSDSKSVTSKEYNAFSEAVQSIALDIIHGKPFGELKAFIAPEAYVIDGNHYENLYAVLNGEVTSCRVTDGPGVSTPFLHVYLTDDRSAATVVVKSIAAKPRRERYHTVFLVRQSGGNWQVRSWHVSGKE
jgi:TonB family protein